MYLRFTILFKPANNTTGKGLKTGHADAGMKRLEQLIGYPLKLGGGETNKEKQENTSRHNNQRCGGGGVRRTIKKSLTTMNLTWSGTCCELGDD